MSQTLSPLRWPGGKSRFLPLALQLLEGCGLAGSAVWAEPFAGGAGLGLRLLADGACARLLLNDADPAVHAFWRCVLERTDALCHFVSDIPVSLEERARQREVFLRGGDGDFEALGKAALYLNRVNVSGVLRGGPIGGKAQTGRWNIAARFGRKGLIRRITNIAAMAGRIELSCKDARTAAFYQALEAVPSVFVFCDPPYPKLGKTLYGNFAFGMDGHRELRDSLDGFKRPWACTCGVSADILALYAGCQRLDPDFSWMASRKKGAGLEAVFLGDQARLPDAMRNTPARGGVPKGHSCDALFGPV